MTIAYLKHTRRPGTSRPPSTLYWVFLTDLTILTVLTQYAYLLG